MKVNINGKRTISGVDYKEAVKIGMKYLHSHKQPRWKIKRFRVGMETKLDNLFSLVDETGVQREYFRVEENEANTY